MTYNVFGGTLSLTQSINQSRPTTTLTHVTRSIRQNVNLNYQSLSSSGMHK